MNQPEYHIPVLYNETLALLDIKAGGVYVDCTLGGGGHAKGILEKSSPNGFLIGLDRDQNALDASAKKLSEYAGRFKLIKANFKDIKTAVESAGFDLVDGILFDFGVSSHQLDAPRGFSFTRDEPLDMRMSQDEGNLSAAYIVNNYTEDELVNIFFKYGEERYSRRIANAIVEYRLNKQIETTKELVEIIIGAVGGRYREQKIHPATRTFQALRIACNDELAAIEQALPDAVSILKPSARIAAISFHSLEDVLVKKAFSKLLGKCVCPPRIPICQCNAKRVLNILTKKPITASDEEIRMNIRARSAKLRGAEKVI